jgi:hypothetical protein
MKRSAHNPEGRRSDKLQEKRKKKGRGEQGEGRALRRGKKARSSDCGCEMAINLTSKGTVNIYNCPPASGAEPQPGPEPGEACPPPPRATGACIPVAPGAKHKSGLQDKLRPLLQNSPAPSVLAATIVQQMRRYEQGRSPGNELEASVFEVLSSLPPELQDTLSCALDTFEGLPKSQRDQLFSPGIFAVGDQALSTTVIAELFADELADGVVDAVFDDGSCTAERPGLARPIYSVFNGGAFLGFLPSICRVNGLRTIYFNPNLSPGEYLPEEFEQACTPKVVDGEVELNCVVLTEDCPGHLLGGEGGGCLRVPDVRNGESVLLEGINFFNIEGKVRLQAKAPGTASAEVDAFVCGDQETLATEEKNGVEVPINDCRVHDRLTFQIPDDLPAGIYEARVVMPNNTGVENTEPVFTSQEVFIRVLPALTSVFQIASEKLVAKAETSPAWFGSDEVGIRILAVPIFANGTLGSMTPINFRFGDVDSGEERDMSRVLIQESGLSGVSIAMVGFEVDSERAFENQIDSFTDAFVDILKRVWDAIKEEASGAIAGIVKKFGVKGIIAVVIAAIIALVVIAIVALWAPADLIIEDNIGLSAVDLANLTDAGFPAPPEVTFTSSGDIDVKVVPVSKAAVQYRERREYKSDDEDSEYHIALRYNRLS